jgi:hypothetical protein
MSEVLNPEPLLRALHEAGVEHIIIAMKRAAGRPRDIDDLQRLGAE